LSLPYRFFLFDPEDSRQRSDRRVESDIGSDFGKTRPLAMDSARGKWLWECTHRPHPF
jgi:hypothetical protein